MARKLVAVALVGAVVAVAWFAWREKAAPEVASEREVVVPAEVEHETRVELSRDTSPVVRPKAPSRVETQVAEMPITAAPVDGLEVIVVDGRSGVPVAGARVRGLGLLEPMSSPDARKEVPIGLLDFEIELAGGAVYETDATGRTRIPKDGLPASYAATAPGRWGMAYFSAAEKPPHVIELSPERGARVLVVDASGRPVPNMPVAIACDEERFDDLVESLSDEQGFVDVRHWRAAQQKCLEGASTCVRPLVLASLETIPCLHVDTNPGAPDPQRLVLPALGRVEVRVRSVDGVLLEPRELVLSHAAAWGRDGQPQRETELFSPDSAELGRATFERVGVGCEVRASSDRLGVRGAFVMGSGPRAPGETVVLELVVDLPFCLITGRFVGPDGSPIAHAQSALVGMPAPARPGAHVRYAENLEFTTDPLGRFRVPVWRREGAPPNPTLEFNYIDDSGRTHRAWLTEPPPLKIPATELGDVQFVELRRIVAGVLVAPSGIPLDSAWVRVEPLREPPGTASSMSSRSLREEVGADGTFELWSDGLAPRWTISAGARQCENAAPVEVPAGATGVRVVLGDGGVLRGVVLVDASIDRERVLLELWRNMSVDELTERTRMVMSPAADGRFAFAVARGGSFELYVTDARRKGVEVLTLNALDVADGLECGDPRLRVLDLRGRLDASARPTPR